MVRIDQHLVSLGLFNSRAKSVEAIKAGLVTVDGKCIKKPSFKVTETAKIAASAPYPWVSRGGVKLAHALDYFHINVEDHVCLDVGSSTGGFTDVLLSRGAAQVYAVDVGTDQLHPKIKADTRVVVMENRDARTLTGDDFSLALTRIVCDASFISVMKVMKTPLKLACDGAVAILLVKPQFEVGRLNLGKGGVVKSDTARKKALLDVLDWLGEMGWSVTGHTPSPIHGGDGNTEYLVCAVKPQSKV